MSNATTNGQGTRPTRKTLSHQIDRLDQVLDGLADALQGSVAQAVSQAVGTAVREAVEAALKEALANPELLRAALAQQQTNLPRPELEQPPVTVAVPMTGWDCLCAWCGEAAGQLKDALGGAWAWGVRAGQECWGWLTSRWQDLAGCLTGLLLALLMLAVWLWQFRRSGALALSVGLLAAAASYLAGPLVASLLCGLCGAALTLAGLVLAPLFRLLACSRACA